MFNTIKNTNYIRFKSYQSLLTSIAHHWRQPLNVIALKAQMLESEFEETEEQKYKSCKEKMRFIENETNDIQKEVIFLSETIDKFSNIAQPENRISRGTDTLANEHT